MQTQVCKVKIARLTCKANLQNERTNRPHKCAKRYHKADSQSRLAKQTHNTNSQNELTKQPRKENSQKHAQGEFATQIHKANSHRAFTT